MHAHAALLRWLISCVSSFISFRNERTCCRQNKLSKDKKNFVDFHGVIFLTVKSSSEIIVSPMLRRNGGVRAGVSKPAIVTLVPRKREDAARKSRNCCFEGESVLNEMSNALTRYRVLYLREVLEKTPDPILLQIDTRQRRYDLYSDYA